MSEKRKAFDCIKMPPESAIILGGTGIGIASMFADKPGLWPLVALIMIMVGCAG